MNAHKYDKELNSFSVISFFLLFSLNSAIKKRGAEHFKKKKSPEIWRIFRKKRGRSTYLKKQNNDKSG
jgi:hypothetical protein